MPEIAVEQADFGVVNLVVARVTFVSCYLDYTEPVVAVARAALAVVRPVVVSCSSGTVPSPSFSSLAALGVSAASPRRFSVHPP